MIASRQRVPSYDQFVSEARPTVLSVSRRDLVEFSPRGLGSLYPELRTTLESLPGLRQTEIITRLRQTTLATKADSPEHAALRVTLLVLADYVAAGYYPVVRRGRCALAPMFDSSSGTGDRKREALRRAYEQARLTALRDRARLATLTADAEALGSTKYQPRLLLDHLRNGPPAIDVRRVAPGMSTDRLLWRVARATWSLPPDASAPGREVSFLVGDRRVPDTPAAIFQFRNVLPEIKARDLWVGLTDEVDGAAATGFTALLLKQGDPAACVQVTRRVLETLLASVRRTGDTPAFEFSEVPRLIEFANVSRGIFNQARQAGDREAAADALARTKRAETAADLLRGIEGFRRARNDPRVVRDDPEARILVNAGLRKLWHFHMGFVAIELSICGAAPPFGPLRTGKLAAALAASAEALSHWGFDRPLGEIASTVYDESVRERVPNPGPLLIFTSGLYPDHSAQYNRVSSGSRRWRKIGDTAGWGAFHISPDTVEAINAFNVIHDGYEHITHSFGEGSGPRFRAIGRALDRLNLPDLRRHNTRRPLYALSLVEEPAAVLLGWKPASGGENVGAHEIGTAWWDRWVKPQAAQLADAAARQPDLGTSLESLLRHVRAGDVALPDAEPAGV
jgi:hypothetical protein